MSSWDFFFKKKDYSTKMKKTLSALLAVFIIFIEMCFILHKLLFILPKLEEIL